MVLSCLGIATLAFVGIPFIKDFLGPSNYDDCILQGMKGVANDFAAGRVQAACLSKFPPPPVAHVGSTFPPAAAPAPAPSEIDHKYSSESGLSPQTKQFIDSMPPQPEPSDRPQPKEIYGVDPGIQVQQGQRR